LTLRDPPRKINLRLDFQAQVSLSQTGYRETLDIALLAPFLHSVAWNYSPDSAHVLNRLLGLPNLKDLTLIEANGVRPVASPACGLERLVLVDCSSSTSLGFLDNLPRLRSLGLHERYHSGGLLPSDVPKSARRRIERLDVRHHYLAWRESGAGTVTTFKFDYPNLRWLRLESPDPLALAGHPEGPILNLLVREIECLSGLETLQLCAILPALPIPLGVSSLELDCGAWTSYPCPFLRLPSLPLLRDLVLRNFPRGYDVVDFRLPGLEKLKLVGQDLVGQDTRHRVRLAFLPSLRVLELEDLTWVPETRHDRLHTLYMASDLYRLLFLDEQLSLKAAVANFYLTIDTGIQDRLFFTDAFH
jgi:hypothetical protein